jgi:phytoene dehydrogenase-like protein
LNQAGRSLGELGLPASVSELASRRWDCVVIGAGHNGLCAATYLARFGCQVLVLEQNVRIGGACTLERPFSDPGWIVSPCAYLVGLLHPIVVEELGLQSRGYRVQLVDPHLWCPFEDGSAVTLWDDELRSAAAIRQFSPSDAEGYLEYCALFARVRRALREGTRDTWIGEAPERAEIEELLGNDHEATELVFDASIADVVERYVRDERLRTALHGQGIIGTNAGPRDPGTAAIHLMHTSGSIEDHPGAWGYVRGGMGNVSFALADAARESGAVVACGVGVVRILPGEGVRLSSGELVRARTVVSNADPKRTLAMCESEVPETFRHKVARWRSESPVLKINCALSRLPKFVAHGDQPHRAMITISDGIDRTQAAYEAARRGDPAPEWCELYFQSVYDSSVAPEGQHTMSVFAQYVPYSLAEGTWDERRDQIADAALAHVARFAPDVTDTIVEREVLGPPDVERRIGLSGGHIFQGECLPDQMWSDRFAPGTPVPGLYLCGAATHPGGSVIAVNGRNAAMKVLADLGRPLPGDLVR